LGAPRRCALARFAPPVSAVSNLPSTRDTKSRRALRLDLLHGDRNYDPFGKLLGFKVVHS